MGMEAVVGGPIMGEIDELGFVPHKPGYGTVAA